MDDYERLPLTGPVGIVEWTRHPNAEAGRAYATLTSDVAAKHAGQLTWAGHVDQLLIGDVDPLPDQILVTEFPSRSQANLAWAARLEWGIERLIKNRRTYGFKPAPFMTRNVTRGLFGFQRLLRRQTPTLDLERSDIVESLSADTGIADLGPTRQSIHEYATCGIEGKVVMFNLLRYKRDESGDRSAGVAAYGRYGRRVVRLIGRMGGVVRAQGSDLRALAADSHETWDAWVAVQYPSRADFLGMIESENYRAGHADRDAGLERTALIVCTSHVEHF